MFIFAAYQQDMYVDNNSFKEISISLARTLFEGASYIEDLLLLIDKFEEAHFTEGQRMSCALIALCTAGSGTYTVDAKEYTVKKDDVIIISEGQVLSGYTLNPGCKGIAFVISYEFIDEILKGIQNMSQLFLFSRTHPVYTLSEEESKTFVYYFNLIKQKVDDTAHLFRKELVASLMKALLFDLGNEIWAVKNVEKSETRAEHVFRIFIKLVETHFRQERHVGWYAQQLCISPKYLSETVKQISHRTPNDWIDHYVIVELRVQLKNTMKSIKEITADMNFPNQSFLGKYFKEHTGVSPSKYRKS